MEISLLEDIKVLKRIVIEGNGTPSLVSRVSKLETKLAIILTICSSTFIAVSVQLIMKFFGK